MAGHTDGMPCIAVVSTGGRAAAGLGALVRATGLRPVLVRRAEALLDCSLSDDPLLVVLDDRGSDGKTPAAAHSRRVLAGLGRAGDLVVWPAPGGSRPRCRRQLKRHLRRQRRAHQRAREAQAADPAWQALLADYRADLRLRMSELEAAVQSGDTARGLALVHDVKGSAGGYGLGSLTPLAAEAQDAFLAGDVAAAFSFCARLVVLARDLTQVNPGASGGPNNPRRRR
jgi:HPt (histidine-containing phosphotransfer) domain-containing protein